MEVRELLSFYKFPGDDVPVIRGSALCALNGEKPALGRDAILKLMAAGGYMYGGGVLGVFGVCVWGLGCDRWMLSVQL